MKTSIHLSLDFWGTIATANPLFTQKRNEYLANELNISVDIIREEYTKLKKFLDNGAAEYGIAFNSWQCWKLFFDKLGPNIWYHGDKITTDIYQLFYQYPPIISNDIIDELDRLQRKGITYNISTNLNFIRGGCIWHVAKDAGLSCDFIVASDDVGYSKPSINFFDKIYGYLLPKTRVVHIGNDQLTDGGATKAGMEFILVENPLQLPEILAKF